MSFINNDTLASKSNAENFFGLHRDALRKQTRDKSKNRRKAK